MKEIYYNYNYNYNYNFILIYDLKSNKILEFIFYSLKTHTVYQIYFFYYKNIILCLNKNALKLYFFRNE